VTSTDLRADPEPHLLGRRFRRLRIANVAIGAVLALEAAAMLALSNGLSLPVFASYLQTDPVEARGAPPADKLFSLPIGPTVALFLALAALDHFVVAAPRVHRWHEHNLTRHVNYARWIEYSISASIMIVLIAMFVGIRDIAALLAIFGVNTAMILFGWLQERYEHPGSGGWLPFSFGSVAGVVPWVAITIYLLSPGSSSSASPPGFVYGIFVSLFIFFNSFALNQWLQYRAKGRFQDYLVGEKAYIVLSLTAKSALAWQIFAGTLAPA
jgi:hypothetical protein